MDLGLGSLIGGAFSAVSNLLGTTKTNIANLKIAKQTNNAQKQLAKYQAEQNYKLWQENNAYNTPAAQMERYNEAGLNPNLIYGNGQSSAGNSSSPAEGYKAPTLQRAVVDYSGIASSSQALMNGLINASQIKKTDAEIDALRQNTENLKVDHTYKELQVAYQNLVNSKTEDEASMWKSILEARKANLLGGAHQSESSALTNDALRPLLVAQKAEEVSNMFYQNAKLEYFINNIQPLQRKELIAKMSNLAAQTQLYRSNSLLSSSNVDLNSEKWKLTKLQEEEQYIRNQILEIAKQTGVKLDKGNLTSIVGAFFNMINNSIN